MIAVTLHHDFGLRHFLFQQVFYSFVVDGVHGRSPFVVIMECPEKFPPEFSEHAHPCAGRRSHPSRDFSALVHPASPPNKCFYGSSAFGRCSAVSSSASSTPM